MRPTMRKYPRRPARLSTLAEPVCLGSGNTLHMRNHGINIPLVTGGAASPRSHRCESFPLEGYDVLWVDTFFTVTRSTIMCMMNNHRL